MPSASIVKTRDTASLWLSLIPCLATTSIWRPFWPPSTVSCIARRSAAPFRYVHGIYTILQILVCMYYRSSQMCNASILGRRRRSVASRRASDSTHTGYKKFGGSKKENHCFFLITNFKSQLIQTETSLTSTACK